MGLLDTLGKNYKISSLSASDRVMKMENINHTHEYASQEQAKQKKTVKLLTTLGAMKEVFATTNSGNYDCIRKR